MNPSSNQLLRVHTAKRRLSPSEGMVNKVAIYFATRDEEVHQDQDTGIRTVIHFTDDFMDFSINLRIDSTCCTLTHIAYLLFGRIIHHLSSLPISATRICSAALLSEGLATRIALDASNLGFGHESLLVLYFTEQRVSVGSSSLVQKLVFEGIMDGEKLNEVEEEPCSICLEDLLCGGVPTCMPCSHVFHARCLLEWFVRKITCPLCRRRVLNQQRVSNRYRRGGFWF